MAYWLLKTEPSTYSFDNLVSDGTTRWDGVRNPLALKHIRSMSKGDTVMIYHSGDEKAVVGIAEITRAPYPDPKADNAVAVVVDLRAKARLANTVTLADIKKRKECASFELVRISRLSVMPVKPEIWKLLIHMSGGEKKLKAPRS